MPSTRPQFAPTDYGMGSVNPSSFGNFNYTGNWTPIQGGFRGSDAQGDVYYTPFTQQQNRGGVDGPGHWTQDGGWMPDLTSYYGIYQSPDGPNSEDSARFAARYAPGTNLVNLSGNTNLPGVGTNNAGFGYMSRTPFTTERHTPYGMPFDLMADFVMPVVGSAIVGGAGAGLWGAGAEGAAAAAGGLEAGTTWASLPAEYASVIEAGALTGSPGYGAALEGSLAGLGAGTGSVGAGVDAAWGTNMNGYDSFLQSIGIDPASTQFSGGTLTNAEIAAQSGFDPSWWQQLTQNLNGTPSMPSDSTGAENTGSTTGGNSIGTQLGNIFSGNAPLSTYGSLLSTVLGLVGSNSHSNALQGIQNQQNATSQQFQNMGAPYRAAALGMLANPESFYSGQNAQSNLQGVLQGLSVNGNPFGNPTSLALAQQGQRGLYNSTLANLGQLGGLSGFNAAGASSALNPQLALLQAQSQGNMWNAAGAGLNSLLNPQPTMAELLAMIRGQSGGLGGVGLSGNEDAPGLA